MYGEAHRNDAIEDVLVGFIRKAGCEAPSHGEFNRNGILQVRGEREARHARNRMPRTPRRVTAVQLLGTQLRVRDRERGVERLHALVDLGF
jgi:hypothetical protein